MTTIENSSSSRNATYPVWMVIVSLLTIGGVVAWIIQLIQGMVVTDMRNVTSWGLYIVGFMFFVGLSAGGLIMSSVPRVFNIKQYKPISKVATYLSFVSILAAALFILPDIGRPERLWHLIAYANWLSPLVWDVVIIAVYLVLSVVYLWLMVRAEQGKASEGTLKVMAYIALPTAILVHSITAWIFGLQIGRPFWNTAIMAPLFISSALVSGLALLILVVLVLQRYNYLPKDLNLIQSMGALLSIFIMVDLFFLFSEIITAVYPLAPEELEPVLLLLSRTGAPMFWFEVLGGGLVAMVLLLYRGTRRNPLAVGSASALAILGIFFKRFNLLMAGFVLPLVTEPTVQTGPASPNSTTFLQVLEEFFPYFPSLIEWGVAFGVVAFAALLLTIGVRTLPLRPPETPTGES